jgi:outer membrane protein assembly factor BamC
MSHSRNAAAVLCAALVTGLSGCSSSLLTPDRIDYKSASKTKQNSLEVPPDLTAPTKDDRYVVPDVSPGGSATYSAYVGDRAGKPATASTDVLPDVDKMRIERAGSQRWLVVQGVADELWPVIKEFWIELGFIVNVEQPELGIMETDWAEDRAKIPQDIIRSTLGKIIDGAYSTPERDKFRTRLEPGKTPGTVEVYISHRGMLEIYPNEAKDSTVWQPRPADPELEAEMLSRLMVRLGAQEERAKALVASAPQSERAVLSIEKDGHARLTASDGFDRVWRRVGLALDRVGFAVEDRNRTEGIYYVRYIDPDKDNASKQSTSIFSKLLFWRSDEKKSGLKDGSVYRIYVAGEGEQSTVSVLSAEGGEDRRPTARRILGLLHEQLK